MAHRPNLCISAGYDSVGNLTKSWRKNSACTNFKGFRNVAKSPINVVQLNTEGIYDFVMLIIRGCCGIDTSELDLCLNVRAVCPRGESARG